MSNESQPRIRSRILRLTGAAVVGALALSLGFSPTHLSAQQAAGVGAVEGIVKEAGTGRPIAGATVSISAAALVTVTNAVGGYRLSNVPARALEVKVRRFGYSLSSRMITVTAGGTLNQDFTLAVSATALQAVVTTGTAGATEVKRLGNTVATIEPPKYAPINSTSELLQGRVPGVVGLSTSGLAGEGMRIRIRGNASLTQNNEPIVFVDGIRINSQGSGSAGSSISRIDDIDPNIIDRVEILKGAAAATLYGTEASSGVIAITTKRGTSGAPRWEVTTSAEATSFPTNRLSDNWGMAKTQGRADSLTKFWGRTITPFQPFSEPLLSRNFKTAIARNFSVSLTGGSQNLNYFVSARSNLDEGAFDPSKLGGTASDFSRRSSGSFALNTFPTSKIHVGVRGQYISQYADRPEYGNNIYSPITLSIFGKPELANCLNSDPTNTDPDLGVASPGRCKFGGNEVGSPGAFGTPKETALRTSVIEANRYLASIEAQYIANSEFNLSATLGVDYTSETTTQGHPFGYNVDGVIKSNVFGEKGIYQANDREITLDTKANWARDFGTNFNSALVVGLQGFLSNQKYPGSYGYDFPGPGVNVTNAAGVQLANDGVSETVNGGFFGQEQLGYKDFLFLTVGARYDYSSAFGKTAAGQMYPKVSVSFVPTDVADWSFGPVSSWRVRAAWGQSGRQPAALAKFTTFAAAGGPSGAGLGPDNIGNPNLTPEISTEKEVGTELGLFNDALGIELTYWDRSVKDLLYSVQYPPSGGFTNSQLTNIGKMTGNGIELGLKYYVLQRADLAVDVFANVALLKQKITDLGGAPQLKINANYARIRNFLRVGYAPGQMFGAKLKTVPAGSLPYDINRDGIADTEAQMLAFLAVPRSYTSITNGNVIMLEDGLNSNLGKPTPDYTGAFGGSVTYKRAFRLSVLFEYKGGNYTYWCLVCAFRNASPRGTNSREFVNVESVLSNPASTAAERLVAAKDWLGLASLTPYQGLNETSDGSFVRLRELSFTYTLPTSYANMLRARDASISLTGRNLLLWTKYQGVDPEVTNGGRATGNNPDNFFAENVDAFGLPLARRIGVAVRLSY